MKTTSPKFLDSIGIAGFSASPVARHRDNLTGMAGNVGSDTQSSFTKDDFRAMGAQLAREKPPLPRPGHRIVFAKRA